MSNTNVVRTAIVPPPLLRAERTLLSSAGKFWSVGAAVGGGAAGPPRVGAGFPFGLGDASGPKMGTRKRPTRSRVGRGSGLLISCQQQDDEQDRRCDETKANDQSGLVLFLWWSSHFNTPSAFFHLLPCAGNPTTNLRSCLAHMPQVAHVTLSLRVAGQVNTGVPSSSRWNAGASCGSTVTSGRSCFRSNWACCIPFADRLTVNPSAFAFLTAFRLAGVGGLWV